MLSFDELELQMARERASALLSEAEKERLLARLASQDGGERRCASLRTPSVLGWKVSIQVCPSGDLLLE